MEKFGEDRNITEHDQELLEKWLDQWDAEVQRGAQPDPDEFLSRHCRRGPPELTAEFRRIIRRLQCVDRLLLKLDIADVIEK